MIDKKVNLNLFSLNSNAFLDVNTSQKSIGIKESTSILVFHVACLKIGLDLTRLQDRKPSTRTELSTKSLLKE